VTRRPEARVADPGAPPGAGGSGAVSDPLVAPLRATANRELMDAWSLVLASQGIGHQIEPAGDGATLALWVTDGDRDRASRALALADQERREIAVELPPAPDLGPSAAGLVCAVVIAAFYWVSGPRDGADAGGWFRRGAAIAENIMGGETWRAATALLLHADPMHVLGNAVAALIFVTAVGRWLGSGAALLLTLLTGIAGNLLVAAAYGSHHNSVGASTATFGALGLLGGLQVVRWLRGSAGIGRRRRVLSIVAACLGVFAMLGVGERSDVLAHLFGLLSGLLVGAAVGWWARLPLPLLVRHGAGVAAAAVVVGAWWRAFAA
jgi:membrane associated rhomboid family serine protease